ncbi:TIGR04149 family rSAM-modified RiPP [Parabacteroides sp. PF5-9]|uniref:TIGR04149 family rSAM-modified RiPP n=1 Tax=Parabacteroides sp. PF5-9 TaxID=1742404 RepID=UPI0024748B69|nr:TIGR04149 family rSAM-modified RiPP [Parabacteroides sp. PF5-9]MDH6357102.1 natural product precursor [Parabacteroides sp. PF5-9]
MKKLTKIALKEQGSVLKKEEMMKILGGGSYTCWCGSSGGTFIVEVPDYYGNVEAENIARERCGGPAYCSKN